MEQYFIDILQPDLNVDYVASSSGFHGPMSFEARENLRKLRGIPVYVYDILINSLIIIFDSKQHLTQSLGVDLKVIRNTLDTDNKYLQRYIFSTTPLPQMSIDSIMTLDDARKHFYDTRQNTTRATIQAKRSKPVLAEHRTNPSLTEKFASLNECAANLGGDKSTMRKYLNGETKGLYRKVWQLSWVNSSN